MELSSNKGLKFSAQLYQENSDGQVSAQVEVGLGVDYYDGSSYTYVIDEAATLELLRAARAWCEAHGMVLAGPLDVDTFRVTQRWSESDHAIDLDTP